MDRIRGFFSSSPAARSTNRNGRHAAEYAPLNNGNEGRGNGNATGDGDAICPRSSSLGGSIEPEISTATPFSWFEYAIFVLIGVAMLWAWNMFLAAAPYFQSRFRDDEWILANFQATITSVSTVMSLASMLILTKMQSGASYTYRINAALLANIAVFALLTVSTISFLGISPPGYLTFVLLMVACSAWATGLFQNGAFAFAAGFGRPEYTQAIMAGQGVAGVLPALAQMLTVLAVPPPSTPSDGTPPPDIPVPPDGTAPPAPEHGAGKAAFIYFLTAVLISLAAFLAFQPLTRRHGRIVGARATAEASIGESCTSSLLEEEEEQEEGGVERSSPAAGAPRKVVGLRTLFRKLRWLSGTVAMCYAITMFFPVFTVKITSVNSSSPPPRILQPDVFIPLAFFWWNLGDLLGRMATMLRRFSLAHRPKTLFALGLLRWLFLPLYLLCNVGGRGAVLDSDVFYLLLVQFPFGLTNGWLGSSAMMAAGEWVDEGEREAAGGFMGLSLITGLAAGSLLSFSAANV